MGAEGWVGLVALCLTLVVTIVSCAAWVSGKLTGIERDVNGLVLAMRSQSADNADDHRTIWRHLDDHRKRIEGHGEQIATLKAHIRPATG